MNTRTLMQLLPCALLSVSVAHASEKDAEITIRLMDEGQAPASFIREIELPSAENIIDARFDASIGERLASIAADAHESGDLVTEIAITSIKDSISLGERTDLGSDITGTLREDLPLTTDELSDLMPVDVDDQEIVDITDTLDPDAGGSDLADASVTDPVNDTVQDTNVLDTTNDVVGDTVTDSTQTDEAVADVSDTVTDETTVEDTIDTGTDGGDPVMDDSTEIVDNTSDTAVDEQIIEEVEQTEDDVNDTTGVVEQTAAPTDDLTLTSQDVVEDDAMGIEEEDIGSLP